MRGGRYLDQLGALAAHNVSVFQRQVLVHTKGYPLIRSVAGSLLPLPDYWVALFNKRLMGRGVLAAASSDPLLRAYAHCARQVRALAPPPPPAPPWRAGEGGARASVPWSSVRPGRGPWRHP